MNTHNKTPQKKLLMISFTSLLCNSAYSHAANQENIDEIKRQQLRAPINIEQVGAINAHTGRIGESTIAAITGGTGTNLAIIEANLQTAAGQLSTTLGDIEGVEFDTTTDSLHAISDAVASITSVSNITSLGGSGTSGQATDVSYIYSDFASLGQTSGDVSNLNVRLTAIDQAIANIPDTNLSVLEGPDYSTANNSLAALAGTGALPNGSGSTNTFNPATQSLADIAGAGFATADNSLVAISAAIANIPATDLAPIEGGTLANPFDTATDSLYAISNNLISVPFATQAQVTTLGTSALATSAQAADIQGLDFDTANNSLVAISDAIANIPATDISSLATIAQVNNLGTVSDTSGIYTQFTNLQKSLAFIVAQLIGDPIVTVDQAAAYEPLTTAVTVSNTDSTVAYQDAIDAALAAAATAIATATQTSANTQAAIDAVVIAITAFNALATTLANDGGYVTSDYSAAEINAGLAQLNTGLAYLLLNQVA